jgi:transcription elongation factor GreB
MSKAFTKESDDAPDDDGVDDGPALPAGQPNYITPAGLKRLQDELQNLLRVERPKIVEVVAWAAGNGDRSENGDYLYGKKRLREIDRRVRFLGKRLEIARVVDPAAQKHRDQVFFGATVTYAPVSLKKGEDDSEKTVTIRGVDEADLARGEVSWISPVARALLKARVGDTVELRTPSGPTTLSVVRIEYPRESAPLPAARPSAAPVVHA